VRPIGIITGIIIIVTADERLHYEKARASGPFSFVTVCVIPGQPAGLNPESRCSERQHCYSEIPGSRLRAPRNDGAKIWQHCRQYAIEKPAPRQRRCLNSLLAS
jgi:hypothetical protein